MLGFTFQIAGVKTCNEPFSMQLKAQSEARSGVRQADHSMPPVQSRRASTLFKPYIKAGKKP